jgi:UDP-N-acetylmuramoyl-tripeptide--D-alanyl-D-alanine ligase
VGKTTTTQMIATVLAHPQARPVVGRVAVTPGNMNDDVGLPLAILRLRRKPLGYEKVVLALLLPFRALLAAASPFHPKVLVLEYGTHFKGRLSHLASLAPPDIGIVTTIGPAHLARLKTLEGVAEEKSHVVRAVPPSGLVILGQDHAHVSYLEQRVRAPVVKVAGRGIELSQQITRIVCRRLGVPESVVDLALRDFKPPQGRLNRLECAGLTVIDDSFNANPLSMKLGLDTLAQEARPGQRRLAFLGVMAELGEMSRQYHEEVGTYARARADVVIGIGELARHYRPDHWFEGVEACADRLEALTRPGDCLLVKGSATACMSRLVEKLRSTAGPAGHAPNGSPAGSAAGAGTANA